MCKKKLSSILDEELYGRTSVEEIAARHDHSPHETVGALINEGCYRKSKELRRHCELVRVESVGKCMAYTYLMKE